MENDKTWFVRPSEVRLAHGEEVIHELIQTRLAPEAVEERRIPLMVWDYMTFLCVERALAWGHVVAPLDERLYDLTSRVAELCGQILTQTWVLYGISSDLGPLQRREDLRRERVQALDAILRPRAPLTYFHPDKCFFRWDWEPTLAAGVRSRLVSLVYAYADLCRGLICTPRPETEGPDLRMQVIRRAWEVMAYIRNQDRITSALTDPLEDEWQQLVFTDLLATAWDQELTTGPYLLTYDPSAPVIRDGTQVSYDEDDKLAEAKVWSLQGLRQTLRPGVVQEALSKDGSKDDLPRVFTFAHTAVDRFSCKREGDLVAKLMTSTVKRLWGARAKHLAPGGLVFLHVGTGWRPFPNLIGEENQAWGLAEEDTCWQTPATWNPHFREGKDRWNRGWYPPPLREEKEIEPSTAGVPEDGGGDTTLPG